MQYFNNKMVSGRVTVADPEILYLKSLLQHGDLAALSEQSGFSPSHIGAVFRGFSHNRDIIRALKKFIIENKRTEQKQKKDRQDDTSARKETEQLLTPANLKRLQRFGRWLTRSQVEAEDLVHEAVEVLLTKKPYRYTPGKYRGQSEDENSPFLAYVFQIMVNQYKTQRAKAARRQLYFTDEIPDYQVLTSHNAGESNLTISIIDEEIAKASPTLKAVLHHLFSHSNVTTTAKEAGMTLHMLQKYWARVGVPFQEQLQKALELNPQQFPIRPTI